VGVCCVCCVCVCGVCAVCVVCVWCECVVWVWCGLCVVCVVRVCVCVVCVCVCVCEKYNVSRPKRVILMLNVHRISTTGNRLTLDRRRLPVQVYIKSATRNVV